MNKTNILLIEDNKDDSAFVVRMASQFRDSIAKVLCVGWLSEGLTVAANSVVDVCLLDLTLPDGSGIDTVAKFLAACPLVPVIVMTGHDDIRIARQSVAYGAQDYIVKGTTSARQLELLIATAIERKRTDMIGQSLTHAALGGFESEGKDAATVALIRGAISEVFAAEVEKMRYLSKNAPEHIEAMALIDERHNLPSSIRFIQEVMQIADGRTTPLPSARPREVVESARQSVDRISQRATVSAKRRVPSDGPEANAALLEIITRRSK